MLLCKGFPSVCYQCNFKMKYIVSNVTITQILLLQFQNGVHCFQCYRYPNPASAIGFKNVFNELQIPQKSEIGILTGIWKILRVQWTSYNLFKLWLLLTTVPAPISDWWKPCRVFRNRGLWKLNVKHPGAVHQRRQGTLELFWMMPNTL